MNTKKISIISLASVVLLVVALMLGISLTSANAYQNNNINVQNTDITANNVTVDTSTMTKYDENIASNAPEGAQAISNAEELKNFFNGGVTYGYLTADFVFDWGKVGSQYTFASGRTLDGNGHKITLQNSLSVNRAQVQVEGNKYGMFVDENNGTIKNIVFEYNTNVSASERDLNANYVGIVCGINNGTITQCDLRVVGGTFEFFVGNGKDPNKKYELDFGGIAGGNKGIISNITAEYGAFTLNASSDATKNDDGSFLGGGGYNVDATVLVGGIAGKTLDSNAQIRNIIVVAATNTVVNLYAACNHEYYNKGGKNYREMASVVSANSNYTHGTPSLVDNIITYWPNMPLDSITLGGTTSKNAVVSGGPNTNVTVLDTNTNTDHCGCGTSDNSGEHTMSIGNFMELNNVTAKLSMDGNKQIIELTPNDGYVLMERSFNKYHGMNVVDDKTYEGVPENGTISLLNSVKEGESYTMEIPAYQPSNPSSSTDTGNNYYWRLGVKAYKKVELGISSQQLAYTGQNYIDSLIVYNDNGSNQTIPSSQVNLLNNGSSITQISLPGEYNLSFGAVKDNIAYINDEKQVISFVNDKIITLNIDYADITPLTGIDGWLDKIDINFTLQNGIEDAANGYVYTVNGSLPKSVSGLNMSSAFDTPIGGRTYTVYLTKNGQKVSNPIEFNVKVDANAPVISDVTFDYPIEAFYSQNRVYLKVSDMASGINSVMINGSAMDYDSETGIYSANLVNGLNTVEAKDNVGNISTYEINAKVDNVVPQFNADIYYYDDNNTKQTYTGGTAVTSIVYFDMSQNIFGNGGGKVYYSYDGGEWKEFDGILAVTEVHNVKFKAVSNTIDVNTNEPYSFETGDMKVNVVLKDIVITNDSLVISGTDKTFDGTNEFKGSVSFAEGSGLENLGLNIKIVYSDINAGERDLIVEITHNNEKIRVINNVSGLKGNILKKEITVTIDNASKQYGQKNPVFTYSSDMIKGFEEDIEIVTDANENSLPMEYAITVGNTEYKNYVVTSMVKGTLTVNKFVIDRMIYDFTTITGLDTNNAKGVVVGFKQANGEYKQLGVKYQYSATKDGEYADCEGMTLAGYYKVILTLSEEDQALYEIKSGIDTFIVKVIDASIFNPEVEAGEDASLEYVENYAKEDTGKDNAAIVKDYSYINSPDYIIVLAVFCACLIAVIFSIGCGRILVQKHKDNNHNKKA